MPIYLICVKRQVFFYGMQRYVKRKRQQQRFVRNKIKYRPSLPRNLISPLSDCLITHPLCYECKLSQAHSLLDDQVCIFSGIPSGIREVCFRGMARCSAIIQYDPIMIVVHQRSAMRSLYKWTRVNQSCVHRHRTPI